MTTFMLDSPARHSTTSLICDRCCVHSPSILADGRAHCPCGHTVPTSELQLDPDETWCVRLDQTIGYLTAPETALTRYRAALDKLNDHGVWGEEREQANEDFTAALTDLTTARLLGVKLPDGAPADIGRIFLACVLTPDGTYDSSNAYWLGRPCVTCAPYSVDPVFQEAHPCRNPRTHAWGNYADWQHNAAWERRTGRTPTQYAVYSPVAPDIDAARERAVRRFNSLRVAEALAAVLAAATGRVRRTQLPDAPADALRALRDMHVALLRNPAQGPALGRLAGLEDTCEQYGVIAADGRATCHRHRQLAGDCCPA
ncbi:hypothetical protein [Streptomyces sp. NPDC058758]|uniref:hypothetical protein n=1 Tax=Streptomyces sp. NPDC058758 TaxID=3346627 RepID=UPI0036C58D62